MRERAGRPFNHDQDDDDDDDDDDEFNSLGIL